MKKIASISLLVYIPLTSLLIILYGCKKEEVIYPVVYTFNATDISSIGANLNGQLIFGDQFEIDDVGFFWSPDQIPSAEEGYFKIVDSISDNGIFSYRLNSSLIKDRNYYVRAFAKMGENYIYGKPIIFKSLGGMAPEISSIYPIEGWWLDTLIIKGSRFSQIHADNEVFIGGYRAPIIDNSFDTLIIIIPPQIIHSPVEIKVSVIGNEFTFEDKFHIKSPIIESISPLEGNYLQPVTIKGRNFVNKSFIHPESGAPYSKKTIFLYNDEHINLESLNDSIAIVSMKNFSVDGFLPVIANNYNSRSEQSISYNHHNFKLEEVTPEFVDYGDTVNFIGRFYSGVDPSLSVYIGPPWIEMPIIEDNDTSILAKVPTGSNDFIAGISIHVDGSALPTNKSINIQQPIVSDIFPLQGVYGDTLTIAGDHFHPIPSVNKVYIGGVQAQIVSGTNNEIRFLVPAVNSGHHDIRFSLLSFSATIGSFELLPFEITGVSRDTIMLRDTVYFTANNIPNDPSSMFVRINRDYFNVPEQEKTGDTFYIILYPSDVPHGSYDIQIEAGGSIDTWPVYFVNPFGYTGLSRATDHSEKLINSWTYGDTVFWLRTQDGTPQVLGYYPFGNIIIPPFRIFPSIYRKQSTSFVIDTTIFVGLGHSGLSYESNLSDVTNTFYYSTISSFWKPISTFPGIARRKAISFSSQGKGYVGSGFDSVSNSLIDFWQFDSETDLWTGLNDMPKQNALVSVIAENIGYVLFDDRSFYRYETSSDTWYQLSSIQDYSSHIVGFSIGSNIFIAYLNGSVLQIMKYNPALDTWQYGSRRSLPAISFTFSNDEFGFFQLAGWGMLTYDPEKDRFRNNPYD